MGNVLKEFKIKEIDILDSFDASSICDGVPFTQAAFYGNWQMKLGRKIRRFVVESDDEVVAYFQFLKFPLLGQKNYIYIPYGPVLKNYSEDLILYIREQVRKIATDESASFVRFDFTPAFNTIEARKFLSKVFARTPMCSYVGAQIQPRAEWYLDLTKPEEQILKEMHEKTRYSVRLSERKGIKVELVTSDFNKYFDIFYELMAVTATRNGFYLHTREYYKNIFDNLNPETSFLSVSKLNDQVLSVYLVVNYAGVANYIYGCSSNEHREYSPTYLAHWYAICHAKKMGAKSYNFGGISYGDIYKKMNMDSLTVFKKKFGGFEVIHSDFYDLVVNPFWYHLYNLRKFIKQKIK